MLKNVTILLVYLSVSFGHIRAAEIPGIIITKTDTLHVIFKIPTNSITGKPKFKNLLSKITYFDSIGKKTSITPNQVIEIQFQLPNQPLERIVSYNPITRGKVSNGVFLRLIQDGGLRLFEWHSTPSQKNDGLSYFLVNRKLKKIQFTGLIFPTNNLIDFFEDCPLLQTKIKNNEFRIKNLREMVQCYNNNCAY